MADRRAHSTPTPPDPAGHLSHWSELYTAPGIPFIERVQDCAWLVERVQREMFGRDLTLPKERTDGYRGWHQQIMDNLDRYVEPTALPTEGDLVLMIARGRCSHIGVLCRIQDVHYVLHNMPKAGVVLHRFDLLPRQGYEIEGVYRWRP